MESFAGIRAIQGQLFDLWDKYAHGDISINQVTFKSIDIIPVKWILVYGLWTKNGRSMAVKNDNTVIEYFRCQCSPFWQQDDLITPRGNGWKLRKGML